MEDWQIFVLGVIAFQVLKMLALSVNQTVIEQRRKRVVRLVKVDRKSVV